MGHPVYIYVCMSVTGRAHVRSKGITNDLLFDPRDPGLMLLDAGPLSTQERQEGGPVIGSWMTAQSV